MSAEQDRAKIVDAMVNASRTVMVLPAHTVQRMMQNALAAIPAAMGLDAKGLERLAAFNEGDADGDSIARLLRAFVGVSPL